jgi:hypothetical protein
MTDTTICFTVSTDRGEDRFDPNFRDTLNERVASNSNVAVADIGGGSWANGADFDFEATGPSEDIGGLLDLLRAHYPKVSEWEND